MEVSTSGANSLGSQTWSEFTVWSDQGGPGHVKYTGLQQGGEGRPHRSLGARLEPDGAIRDHRNE